MGMYDNQSPNSGQGGRQGSGFGGRLLVALVIAFVGWIMYMNQTEENPVTGQKQHVAISPGSRNTTRVRIRP